MRDVYSRFAARGGWWVVGQGMLTVLVGVGGLVFRGHGNVMTRSAGVALLGMAALTLVLGLLAHGRSLTPFPKPREDAQLIRTGIYGLVRHPLYTANLCGFWGWTLFWASLPAGGAALAGTLFFAAKARREEEWLKQTFADYADYQRRVKRFIPWIW